MAAQTLKAAQLVARQLKVDQKLKAVQLVVRRLRVDQTVLLESQQALSFRHRCQGGWDAHWHRR